MNFKQQVNLVVEAPTKEHPQRKFHLTQLLGSGSEGGAYLASANDWGNNPKQVVIKLQKNMRVNEKDFLTKLIQYQIQYENGTSQQYLPSHIIKIYEYFQWKDNHCVVMEVGKESLFEYITNNRNLQMDQRIKICYQICQPIFFLHSQKLIHRDIKPENFIKVGDIFKLIDFGLVRGSVAENKTQQVGTAIFQAPEILENSNSYTEKVDIWSLACVFYEILSTQPLFNGQTWLEVTTSIKNHKNKPDVVINKIKNLQIAQLVQNILIEMMAYQENKRPTIEWVYIQFKNYYNQPPNQPQLPEQIPEDNQQFKQILSKLNSLENQIKEKDNQMQTLNQTIANIVKQEQLEQDKKKQEQKFYQDEQKKFQQNLIETQIQQVVKDNQDYQIKLDEKFKLIGLKTQQQETKIQESEQRINQQLEQQIQKVKQEIVREQQKQIKKNENTFKADIKMEILEYNSQLSKQFEDLTGEIKKNFQDQLNALKQGQQDRVENQINLEKENKIKLMQIQAIFEEWEVYKTKVNSLKEEVKDIDKLILQNQCMQEKYLILQQINQYTSLMVEDLATIFSNQDYQTSNNVSNYLSNEQDNQDQQTLNFPITQSLHYLNVQQRNQQQNCQNNQLQITESLQQNQSQNLETIQIYKNQLENLRTEILKWVNQYNQKYKTQIKEQLDEKNNQIENGNKLLEDLKKQQEQQQAVIGQYTIKITELQQNTINDKRIHKKSINKLNVQISEQTKEIKELKQKIQELQEKDTMQVQEILYQNQKLQTIQSDLNQAKLPLNQVKALIDYFRNSEKLKEFMNQNNKEHQELLNSINNSY
ncbi:unnamed protein product [Paramecium octaurelia]|uniref:Protein kinase domain-containing protein n=1 Tax=Paramecium octaurelia TaxID=43137 RepID=A0A8S1VMU2_PAROT|nr:unnamed protein product [Paramecium octaurelia]